MQKVIVEYMISGPSLLCIILLFAKMRQFLLVHVLSYNESKINQAKNIYLQGYGKYYVTERRPPKERLRVYIYWILTQWSKYSKSDVILHQYSPHQRLRPIIPLQNIWKPKKSWWNHILNQSKQYKQIRPRKVLMLFKAGQRRSLTLWTMSVFWNDLAVIKNER